MRDQVLSRVLIAFLAWRGSCSPIPRSSGIDLPVASRVHLTINRRRCAAVAAKQWNKQSPIISEFGNRKGKVRSRLIAHLRRSATRFLRPVLFFLFVLPSTNGSIYLDREDLAAKEFDLTMLLALIRVMRNRFRLGARLMCTDLISHG